jgi:hypothetical protein
MEIKEDKMQDKIDDKIDDKKYVIYKNDLKFRSSRNLDEKKIDWEQNNIKNIYKVDHDSFEYRVNDCIKTNFIDLDLEQMNLKEIPIQIFTNDNFLNLKHLFLSNNNIEGFLDLSYFKKLELIDVDNNKITKIKLPNSLMEFSANNNLLEQIPYLEKAKRFRLSNNKIDTFDTKIINKNIEIIEINNNNICNIDLTGFNMLKRFICFTNPLTQIVLSDNLIYADLSETKIVKINNLNKIEHIVLNNCTFLRELPKSDYLKILEIINTPIEKINFYTNFELIILQMNLTKNISSKYKQVNSNMKIRKNIYLVISRGIDVHDE